VPPPLPITPASRAVSPSYLSSPVRGETDSDSTDVCYKPAMYATPEVLAKRKEAWDTKTETTHDPITFNMNARRPPAGHATVDHPKVTQLQEPQLTELGSKLAGVVAW
jgi:hypothetical protein